uniref:Uncharacterized protein n=1 Tax=Meloidogyne floridensis TaxID=298350 RepID=A0A915NIX9_9BILA
LPDIILINNAAHDYRGSLLSTDVIITNVGNVTWLLSALFKSNCAINVKYYPFDDQECTLKFASWGSHDSREIDIGLTTDQGDLSNYLNSTEFDLLSFKAERRLIRFSTDKVASWPMIIATIKMRRRPLFYVILSMGVYLQSIIESIPPTSETVPLIGIYYVASLAIVCLATAMNVYTLNVHRRGITNQSRVPWWMRKYILGYLATILFIRVHEPDSTRRSTIRRISLLRDLKHIKNMENCKETRTDESKNCECMENEEVEEEKLPSSLNLKRRLTFADCSEDGCSPRIERKTRRLTQCTQESIGGECVTLEKMLMEQVMPRLNAVRPVMSTEFEERFRKILKRVYRSLQQFEIRDEVIDERKRIIWQWRTLASIIDRFLLFTFSFITLFTVTIFIIFPILFRERLLGQNEFIS